MSREVININSHAPLSPHTHSDTHAQTSLSCRNHSRHFGPSDVCVDGVITGGLAAHSCLGPSGGEAAISSQHELRSEAMLLSMPSVNK